VPPPLASGEAAAVPLRGELRFGFEFARLAADPDFIRPKRQPDAPPALLVPGFLAGDSSLLALRGWLRRRGSPTAAAGIWLNVDCGEQAVRRLDVRLREFAGRTGRRIVVVGQSRGGELARVLEWVDVVGAEGTQRRSADELGFAYRRSSLEPGAVVARASFALAPAASEEVKATLAEMRARRKAAQPSGIKTFGSTFKNPADPAAEGRTAGQLLDAAGCRGLRIGGASFSAKHANFVENHGTATTADVLAVMAEGRRRVKEQFGIELEPEVQALGPVEIPSEGRGDGCPA